MINPNKTYNVKGKIVAIEKYTSMAVYKVETEHGIFDYTVFGQGLESLTEGTRINAVMAYSITLNGYFIKSVSNSLKVA